MEYIIWDGQNELGPYDEDHIRRGLLDGTVNLKSLVRPIESGDWQPLETALEEVANRYKNHRAMISRLNQFGRIPTDGERLKPTEQSRNAKHFKEFLQALPFLLTVFFLIALTQGISFCSGDGNGKSKIQATYDSATEKLDKGIPLNKDEARAINNALDLDRHRESEQIERKNGER